MLSQIPAIDALLFVNITMSIFAFIACALRRYGIMKIALYIAFTYSAFIGVCALLVKYCA